MKNPTMIYRHPGKHKIHGNIFDFKIVDEDQVSDELSAGWFLTTSEALAGVPNDDMPPNREELEQKAKELGVAFRSNTSDETIMQRINEAL